MTDNAAGRLLYSLTVTIWAWCSSVKSINNGLVLKGKGNRARITLISHAWESVNYAGWMTCQHYSHGFPAHGRCSHYQQAVSIAAFICSSSRAVALLQVLEQLLQTPSIVH